MPDLNIEELEAVLSRMSAAPWRHIPRAEQEANFRAIGLPEQDWPEFDAQHDADSQGNVALRNHAATLISEAKAARRYREALRELASRDAYDGDNTRDIAEKALEEQS